jgi:hypothetical protein
MEHHCSLSRLKDFATDLRQLNQSAPHHPFVSGEI